ncbi:amidohydrolase family protein [Cellulosimicrobium arenosum]|uniref:Amidohydrolase n=1 Tax=Cellulosimicrobium arenosum TaxID=2708133 RepID=A0A927PFV4_9MICO|nr:amidohydrolase [Cellulosimicrobium arenosum]MBD8079940.1 amidohydrolase [Cellulosimicrobium arenosum]
MTRVPLGRAVDGGTLLPPFTDAHVHLGLIDATALLPHGIAAVHDLGWVPDVAAGWARAAESAEATRLPQVAFAGAFLTAPGGYPSGRAWAPDGSVEEVASPAEAVAAVDRQLAVGASFVKVALNSAAGPVPDDVTLAAIAARAHARGATVVAHAEGPGQAARAFEAGVDRLAHAPFSEPLPDALLAAMSHPHPHPQPAPHPATRRRTRPEGRKASENDLQVVFGRGWVSRMSWVSTLDVHGWGVSSAVQDLAIDNVRRFAAAGGTVVYGTDLGNGPLPVGVNERELRALAAAGLDPKALLRTLTSTTSTHPAENDLRDVLSPRTTSRSFSAGWVTFVPGEAPSDPDDLPRWLAGATTVPHPGMEQT